MINSGATRAYSATPLSKENRNLGKHAERGILRRKREANVDRGKRKSRERMERVGIFH